MTREEVAKKIRWHWIMSAAGMANVLSMLPQLWQVWTTKETEGLSLEMVGIFLAIQLVFAGEGYFKRSSVLVITMILSALVSVSLIILVLYIRV